MVWKYGDEIYTTYSGNVLDRLSFLRDDHTFLAEAFSCEEARFVLFNESKPLLKDSNKLPLVKLQEIESVVENTYSRCADERVADWDPIRDRANANKCHTVFLGLDSKKPSNFKYRLYAGVPVFAVDLTCYPHTLPDQRLRLDAVHQRINTDPTLEFKSVIFDVTLLNHLDYSIIAESLVLLDWATRTPFCAGCGHRNLVVHAGFKLVCPASIRKEIECPTTGRVNNIQFPRTDTCVIMAILNKEGDKCLLGRGRRFKFNMYSCLAGFLEGGESIEDCVRREVFEECGLKIGTVRILASQPWPYPANLMIGCVCQLADDATEEVYLNHDPELLDAKWVTITDLQLLCQGQNLGQDFVLPPPTSIAWTLLNEVSKL